MPRIITDIDGTLIDKDGQTIQKVVDYIKAEAEEVVVLTNRPESDRAKTVADLKATGLEYAQLIMNKDGTPAPEFKAATVKAMLDAGVEVDEFIDNDQANRDAVEALGVEVCDPAEIVAGMEDTEEDPMEEAMAFDRTAKIKNAMSKLTPEAEVTELRTVAVALTAELVAVQKTLDDAKAPTPRYAVLNSTYISDLRQDTQIVGNNVLGAQIIRDGDLGVIAGARVYQFANLSANSENLAGWVAGPDAIAFASALPETDIPGWEVANATDETTGLSVQVIMGQEQSGYMNVTATLLFGAAVGRSTSLIRLKTA